MDKSVIFAFPGNTLLANALIKKLGIEPGEATIPHSTNKIDLTDLLAKGVEKLCWIR